MTPTASTLRLPSVLFAIRRLLPWLNLPAGALLALLPRTPAVQAVIRAGEQLVGHRGGEVLRAAFTLAGLGALHGRAGATTFIVTQGSTQIINATPQRTTLRNPATGSVGTTLTPVAFTYTGTPSAPQYWVIGGFLPQGLTISPAPNLGVVRSTTPVITGTPIESGSFTLFAQAYGIGGQGIPEPIVFAVASNAHSADSDKNFKFSLLELTRVIELYNTRNGTTRTGCYAVASTSTEDGFNPDADRNSLATVSLSSYHSADSNR
ncbi:MAG: hypothetical protein ACKOE8_12775, partial [Opitutaceae bacterium]